MHVRVRHNHGNAKLPFLLTVTGAVHRHHFGDFTMEFANQGEVWKAAREVSEKEQDYRVAAGPGW